MDWLHTPSYWWAMAGAFGNIGIIMVFVAVLVALWREHEHPVMATLAFAAYLTLFLIQPHPQVQAYLDGGQVQPASALRVWAFLVAFALTLFRALRFRKNAPKR